MGNLVIRQASQEYKFFTGQLSDGCNHFSHHADSMAIYLTIEEINWAIAEFGLVDVHVMSETSARWELAQCDTPVLYWDDASYLTYQSLD